MGSLLVRCRPARLDIGLAVDIGVIKSQMTIVSDHETRIRALESLRAKLGAIWAAGVAIGAAIGWLAAFLSGRR